MKIIVDEIRLDGGTQPRAIRDEQVVSDYAEAMRDGATFPPVTVFYDGAVYWLADGFHRVYAAKANKTASIEADVQQGTQRDAILFSVGANAAHGLRRTNMDKRRAVERLLRDDEWVQWSDREIARRCAVSKTFVSNMRPSLATVASENNQRTYTTKHGTPATMKTGAIGRQAPDGFVMRLGLPHHAPLYLSESVDIGEVALGTAVALSNMIHNAPERVRNLAIHLQLKDMNRAAQLIRFHKSSGTPDTNGTFDEIEATGGFAYGDEMEKWCDFANDPIETIYKARDSIVAYHRAEGVKNKPHVAHNSGENEWYTPPEYIEAARRVLGDIDLDPASSELANQTVQAKWFYSLEDSGLEHDWRGTVWMNPPYAGDLIKQFTSKFAAHVKAGDITAGIVLVNNATETQWFYELANCARAVVFPKGRIRYISPDGKDNSPLQGQAILYFGTTPQIFLSEFEAFGWGATMS